MRYEQEMQQRWIARRDANAFTELVQQHAGMVFATCRRVLGDATEAEDVAHEIDEIGNRGNRDRGRGNRDSHLIDEIINNRDSHLIDEKIDEIGTATYMVNTE